MGATYALLQTACWQDLCSIITEAACPFHPWDINKGQTGFSGLGPGATFHSIPFLWNPMLLARALLEAPQSMIAAAESFLPRAAGLCSRLLREYLGFRLRLVSKWPNQATGWAAWPAPGSSCRGQVQGDRGPALGREAA